MIPSDVHADFTAEKVSEEARGLGRLSVIRNLNGETLSAKFVAKVFALLYAVIALVLDVCCVCV